MGHGNHWEAIFPSIEEAVTQIPEIIARGKPLTPASAARPGSYFLIQYPEDTPVTYLAVVSIEEGSNSLASAYPAVNDGEITDVEFQSREAEEEESRGFESIATLTGPDARDYAAFEPHFPGNSQALTGRQSVRLGAIAYSIEPAKTELEITEGTLVEIERERVAEEGGDPASVQSVTVSTKELRCYFHHGLADFEFQSVVEEIETFSALEIDFMRLKIRLGPADDSSPFVALFVSPKAAAGFIPKVGDAIMGTGWLQAIPV